MKIISLLQVRVLESNPYNSCDDSIPAAEKVVKNDDCRHSEDQPLRNDGLGNIACRGNSGAVVSIICFPSFIFLEPNS